MLRSPYDTAPDRSFWSRSVSRDFSAADLLAPGAVLLRKGDRVASAGSCFAANIVPYLERSGFAYVRTETPHPALRVPPENLGYANFSAAYGNIYTARQLVQMLYRCLDLWHPRERVWQDGDSFIDPFRPGLRYRARSAREFDLLTRQHLACVRRVFTEATVFVFTLGLTEAWVSRDDGAVFPACPGTVAGTFDPNRHAFHNMTAAEVTADLNEFVREVRKLNPALRLILTVSPVPLVATATGGHALLATIYSKSVLRVAAAEVAGANAETQYFPAYEIVTGPQAPQEYFEEDRRNVSKAAVEAVMAALLARCEGGRAAAPPAPPRPPRPAAPPPVAADDDAPAEGSAQQALSSFIVDAECEEVMSDAGLARV
jgi:hypothetical protein